MTEQKIELKMIRMSEVQSQEIEWLWYPFIPYGKLTIIQGDPGDGKTTIGKTFIQIVDNEQPVVVVADEAVSGSIEPQKQRSTVGTGKKKK